MYERKGVLKRKRMDETRKGRVVGATKIERAGGDPS